MLTPTGPSVVIHNGKPIGTVTLFYGPSIESQKVMKTYQIHLDETKLIKDGKQYEPTGEFRKPIAGEVMLTAKGPEKAVHNQMFSKIILRETWTWPSWLKGWGIAMDSDGSIWLHEHEPVYEADTGEWIPGKVASAIGLDDDGVFRWWLTDHSMSAPPVTRDKPILNPNYVAPDKA